ncbi:MAG: hypothetical protein COU40_02205 [Candidatus Moranbacteria bacterium CG10_big_fil_rev_8_21_14_0_10_35_21]|nr:MAG: hypothetical protein COU40_02205 [Candidatus Moranbacteria bacterium CG10_big_fil_rev_8_21_14_0_10_35_21]PJA88817.1 MAG: hypothetical protein CO139_01110 [Candidatus Moranbacteria bacterium CG_4_9_14_3_um_filter_36_9]
MSIKEHLSILKKLSVADIISLSAILPTVTGYYFILDGKPNQAIIAASFAFFLDTLDGYVARKLKIESEFGRQLDSFVDALNYLTFTSIFTLNFLSFNKAITIVSVFIMISAGILRLSRFNLAGLVKDNNEQYYIGLPVPFAQLSVIVLFISSSLLFPEIIYFTPLIIILTSFLMISNIKFKKPKNYWLWYILTLFIICLAVINLNK